MTEVIQLRLGPELLEWPAAEVEKDTALQKQIAMLEKANRTNPLQFWAPHGEEKLDEPDQGPFRIVSMREWVNDNSHTMFVNKSPNQSGKTCGGVVKVALLSSKCNPNWTLFKQHGIVCPDWIGPKQVVILGYTKGQIINVLWPELQKWVPDDELGEYRSPENGGTKWPTWDRNPQFYLKKSKSHILFLSYDQFAYAAAGMKVDIALADEQMPHEFFSELNERGRTRGGLKWIFPYTPHKVEARPDSGASSFLEEIWRGTNTYGHTVLRTRIHIPEVPDHIYSQEQKDAAYEQWVEIPKRTGNEAAIREGLARYYGIAQQPAGLFYPEFTPHIHVIDLTPDDIKKLPGEHYRYVDYGTANPTACIWVLLTVTGELIIYRDYYERGLELEQHARNIIEASGNIMEPTGRKDVGNGMTIDTFRERVPQTGQKFIWTKLDWHCFRQPPQGGGLTMANYFQLSGLPVRESSRAQIEDRSQHVRMLLKVNEGRQHIITNELGAPRVYFCRNARWAIWEMERCLWQERQSGGERHNAKEMRQDKDDHCIDCIEWMACDMARRVGIDPSRMKIYKGKRGRTQHGSERTRRASTKAITGTSWQRSARGLSEREAHAG